MSQVSFAFTLAHELHGRLRRFGHLRWLAVGGLIGAGLLGPRGGFPQAQPGLFFIALAMAAYNLTFAHVLRRRGAPRTVAFLQTVAILEIALDLAALLATMHLSHGLRSPTLPLIALPMVIGTILLRARTMYLVAAATCAALLGMHGTAPPGPDALDLPLLAVVIVTVFGTVHLTGLIVGSLRRGSLRLLDTTLQLAGETARLEEALAEIRRIEARKSQYMRLSAHQLRSPLATIKTSLDVLSQGFVDPASPRGQQLIRGVGERAGELLLIVNDLLNLAKVREGQGATSWESPLDLRALLAAAIEELRALAESRAVRLRIALAEGVLLDRGARENLRFAFDNVIHNAIKYSHPGGEVRVALDAVAGQAFVVISDDGIGIPEAMQASIFVEFVRAPNAKHHASEGTGLGLAIAQQAIELHGGQIALESREGRGTTVTITLPLSPPPPERGSDDTAR